MKFYNNVLDSMTRTYEKSAGYLPDDASDIAIRLKVLAGQLDLLNNHIDVVAAQLFPQSSTGEHLERHALLRGLSRKKESPAVGTLVFARTTPAPVDISLPKGTLASTSSEPTLFFVTTQSGTLKAGASSVSVPAAAQKEGTESNIAAGKVSLLVSSVPGITTVSNQCAFSGAFDRECDQSLRQRLLSSYQNMATGSNVGFYYNYAIAHPNVRFAKIIPKVSGLGTVGIVLALKDTENGAATLNELNKYFQANREICSVVLLSQANEKVVDVSVGLEVKEGYIFESVAKACEQAVREYIAGLGIGGGMIRNILGKVILDVEGAYNYTIAAPSADILIGSYDFAVSGNVAVSRKG